MASRRVTVEWVAGGSYVIGGTVNIGGGRLCVAVGATLHVSVVVGEDTAIGGFVVTFLAVIVEEWCSYEQGVGHQRGTPGIVTRVLGDKGMLLTNHLEASTGIADDFMEWLSDVECTECLLTASLANALVGLSDIKVGLLRDCAKARVFTSVRC